MSYEISSQQASWYSVHEYVEPLLTAVGQWPMLGSPEWCALPDNDASKIAALYDGARHWALRLETSQQAQSDASRDISAAADWAAVAAVARDRAEFFAARPWLKRVSA